MISDKVYGDQIQRLEAAYMYEIDQRAVDLWREELELDGITDKDLIMAVDAILHNSDKYKFRPSLGNLIEEGNKAKDIRFQKENYNQKQMELEDAKPATEMGKRSLKLIQLILSGKISKKEKVDYMLKMEGFYPGIYWRQEAMKLAGEFGLR